MKKQMLVVMVILAVVAALSAVPAVSLAQANDPASVYKSLIDAMNAGDADTAAGLFAQNSVVEIESEIHIGKNGILTFLQNQIAQHFHDDSGKPIVTNDSLIVQDGITTDGFTALGVTPVFYNIQAVVRNGLITNFTARIAPRSALAITAAAAKAPQTGAVAIAAAFRAAMDVGNAQAAAAFFADDAVIVVPPSLTDSGIYSGKDAIATYLQNQVGIHSKVTDVVDTLIAPGVALATAKVSNNNFTKLGIASLDIYTYVIVRDGKIEQQIVNLTPASAIKLAAALK